MAKVVIFTENNARILKDPINLEYLKTLDNVVVDPDLSKVVGIPPHLWFKDGNSIRPMTEQESSIRLDHHKEHPVVNELHKCPDPEQIIIERIVPQEFQKNKIYQALITGMVIGASLMYALPIVFK